MNEKEKISIIVPVYNVEKYLNECIDSIINQTYKNLEIILVDDGSTDSSYSICEDYKNKDDRIKVFHKENGGLSSARNFGIEKVSGDLLFFVDSDDYIDINTIGSLYDDLKKYDVDIACCTYNRIFDNKIEYYGDNENNTYIFNKEEALKFMLSCYGIASITMKLYKKHIFENIRLKSILYEDLEAIPRIINKISYISYSMKPFYQWRFNNISISNITLEKGWPKKLESYILTINYINENFPTLNNDINKSFILMGLDYLYRSIDIKDDIKERKEFSKVLIKSYNNTNHDFNVNDKIKVLSLKIGIHFFDFCHKLKKLVKK